MAQVRIPAGRAPTPPGEMLLEEFIKPLGMTQAQLADRIGVSYVRLDEIVNGRRGITPSPALLLAKALGTTPHYGSTAASARPVSGTSRRRERAAIRRESAGSARGCVRQSAAHQMLRRAQRWPGVGQVRPSLFSSGDRSTRETAC